MENMIKNGAEVKNSNLTNNGISVMELVYNVMAGNQFHSDNVFDTKEFNELGLTKDEFLMFCDLMNGTAINSGKGFLTYYVMDKITSAHCYKLDEKWGVDCKMLYKKVADWSGEQAKNFYLLIYSYWEGYYELEYFYDAMGSDSDKSKIKAFKVIRAYNLGDIDKNKALDYIMDIVTDEMFEDEYFRTMLIAMMKVQFNMSNFKGNG